MTYNATFANLLIVESNCLVQEFSRSTKHRFREALRRFAKLAGFPRSLGIRADLRRTEST